MDGTPPFNDPPSGTPSTFSCAKNTTATHLHHFCKPFKMSIAVTVQTEDQEARRQRAAIARHVGNRADLHRAMADAAKEVVREHFRLLALSRNSSGGAGGRRAFYSIARDSTVAEADADKAMVRVTGPRGIRQRLKGGLLRPGPGKRFLAIPVDPSVKGVRAAEVHERLLLRPIINRAGTRGILYSGAQRPRNSKGNPTSPKKGEKVRALYALVNEVRQKADPSVLPTESEIRSSAVAAGNAFLTRVGGAR
jgi:hypothetical protein